MAASFCRTFEEACLQVAHLCNRALLAVTAAVPAAQPQAAAMRDLLADDIAAGVEEVDYDTDSEAEAAQDSTEQGPQAHSSRWAAPDLPHRACTTAVLPRPVAQPHGSVTFSVGLCSTCGASPFRLQGLLPGAGLSSPFRSSRRSQLVQALLTTGPTTQLAAPSPSISG